MAIRVGFMLLKSATVPGPVVLFFSFFVRFKNIYHHLPPIMLLMCLYINGSEIDRNFNK
jgi:hypothetical protein